MPGGPRRTRAALISVGRMPELGTGTHFQIFHNQETFRCDATVPDLPGARLFVEMGD